MKKFDTFGVMIDCSRNAVYSVPALKRFLDLISDMGYNMLMLYTEDTFEIEGEPYFGYFRGRYTKKELKELDAYARSRGVELIPCIQTLAHLARIKQQDVYSRHFDVNDILLVGDERVYELIDRMLETCEECFTTRRIHIGMDEAHMLGLGKYLDLHGYTDRYTILKEHLAKVNEIVKKHGFEPMMWSDMFFRVANGGAYVTEKEMITEAERAMVPDGMGVVYWDYYTMEPAIYDTMIVNHKALSDHVWFAGGLWTWTGFLPHNEGSLKMAAPAIDACLRGDIRNVFFTMWGDNGGECTIFSMLPALYAVARMAAGEQDMDVIKAEFGKKYGISFDDFCKVELPDRVPNAAPNPNRCYSYVKNPSKYMTFNDPFYGRYDTVVCGGEADAFRAYLDEYGDLTENEEWGYLFRMSKALCAFLANKYELGARTRRAYNAGDKQALAAMIAEFDEAIRTKEEFHLAFRACWLHDKKPAGFEVQDIRLGGLDARLKSCRERLAAYVAGELPTLEELDEELLDCDGGGKTFRGRTGYYNNYYQCASQSEL